MGISLAFPRWYLMLLHSGQGPPTAQLIHYSAHKEKDVKKEKALHVMDSRYRCRTADKVIPFA